MFSGEAGRLTNVYWPQAVILNSIHLWGVLPSAEERMTMSAGEVKDSSQHV